MNAKKSFLMAMGVVVAVSTPLTAQETKNATHTVKSKPAVVRISDSPDAAGKSPAAATLRISDFGQWKVQPASSRTTKSNAGTIRISDENVARDVPKFRSKTSAWEPIEDAAPPVPGAPHVKIVKEAPEAKPVPAPPTPKISAPELAESVQPEKSITAEVQPIENSPVGDTPVVESSASQIAPEANPFPVSVEEPAPAPVFEAPAEEELVEIEVDESAQKATDAILDDAFKAAEEQLDSEEAFPLIIAAQPDDPAIDGKKVKAAQDVDPESLFGAVTEVRVEVEKSEAKIPENIAGEMLGKYEPVYVMNEGWTEYTDRSIYWISHRPLYFEDPNLERCGLNRNGIFEPIVSAALFYSNAALLPMHMGVQSPCCTVRSKGDCPACHKYGEECYLVSRDLKKLLMTKEGLRGVAYEALAITGLVFLIP